MRAISPRLAYSGRQRTTETAKPKVQSVPSTVTQIQA